MGVSEPDVILVLWHARGGPRWGSLDVWCIDESRPAALDKQTNGCGPVDCSVLVPVLNEERHIRASCCRDARAAISRADSRSCSWTAVRPTARARFSTSWRGADPRLRVFDNPRAGHSERAEHRASPRAGSLGGSDGRAHRLPARLRRARGRSAGAGRHALGERPAGADGPGSGVAGRGAGAADAARTWWIAQVGGRRQQRRRRVRPRLRGVRRRVGDGTRCSSTEDGTRAGPATRTRRWRALPGSRRAPGLPAAHGRPVHPARLDPGPVATVRRVRRVPREDRVASSAHHAPLASDSAGARRDA